MKKPLRERIFVPPSPGSKEKTSYMSYGDRGNHEDYIRGTQKVVHGKYYGKKWFPYLKGTMK